MTYDLHAGTEVSEVIEDVSRKKAEELDRLVDKLLRECSKAQNPAWAVNWGDLACREVSLKFPLCPEGSLHWDVLIEEASPSCGLARWVYDRLVDRGWPDTTEVRCEW